MTKVTVTLNEQQLMELDRIILDEDEPEALQFLREIDRKVRAAQGRVTGTSTSQ